MAQKIILGIVSAMFILVAIWFLLANESSEPSIAPVPAATRASTLVMGAIAGDPTARQEKATNRQALLDYLVPRLTEHGITRGEMAYASSPVELSMMLRLGEVDLFIETVFPAYVTNRLAQAEVLLNAWRQGIEKYHSIIFALASGPVKSLDDLKGRYITFEDPNSSSAYLLPKAELLDQGYKLVEKKGSDDPVAAGEIGYYFVYTDDRLVSDVIEGRAGASGTKPADADEYLQANGLPKETLRVLLKTLDIPRSVAMVRMTLDDALKLKLKALLRVMHETHEGRDALEKSHRIAKFTEFTSDPNASFVEIARHAALIEEEIIRR